MTVFKDTANNEWLIKIDSPRIRAVRKELGLDLTALDGSAWERLQDEVLLVDTLYVLCRSQAQAKNISDELFGELLVGDPIAAAGKALKDAVIDFFPSDKREMVRTLVEQHETKTKLGLMKAMAMMTDPATETRLMEAMDQRMREEFESLLTRLKGVNSSPGSAESPPPA